MTFLDQQNRIPPYVYRYIAAKTAQEIADLGGISVRTVKRMSKRKRWEGIDIEYCVRYVHGCGFEFGRIGPAMKRVRAMMKHGVSGLRHFRIQEGTPLWKRGSVTVQLQSLARTLRDL